MDGLEDGESYFILENTLFQWTHGVLSPLFGTSLQTSREANAGTLPTRLVDL